MKVIPTTNLNSIIECGCVLKSRLRDLSYWHFSLLSLDPPNGKGLFHIKPRPLPSALFPILYSQAIQRNVF